MSRAQDLVQELATVKNGREGRSIREAFLQLPPEDCRETVPALVTLLHSQETGAAAGRAWVPGLLAHTGAPEAFDAMFEQLPREQFDSVRRWLAVYLAKHRGQDPRVQEALIVQLRRERDPYVRAQLVTSLAAAGSASDSIVAALIAQLDDPSNDIRRRAARGLGRLQAAAAVAPLLARLTREELAHEDAEDSPDKKEELDQVLIDLVNALGEIGGAQAVEGLRAAIDTGHLTGWPEVHALRAFKKIGRSEDTRLLELLLRTAWHPDREIAMAATDTLLGLIPAERAARELAHLAIHAAADEAALTRAADALRFLNAKDTIQYLRTLQDDPAHGPRAQYLLERIGGREAVEALMSRRMQTMRQTEQRVRLFEEEGVTLFKRTLRQATLGFSLTLIMSVLFFGVGMLLLLGGAYMALWGGQPLDRWFGAAGGLAGLTTLATAFFREPTQRINEAVKNLVQTEVVFLGYIRQVNQIMATFEQLYVDTRAGFSLDQLQQILQYTERAMTRTVRRLHETEAPPRPVPAPAPASAPAPVALPPVLAAPPVAAPTPVAAATTAAALEKAANLAVSVISSRGS
jgi:HEAT repeat protein